MIRRLAYRSLDLFFPAFANPIWRARARGSIRCFLYHRVGAAGDFPFIDACGAPVIQPDQLRRDIEFLIDQGARFLTFADLRRGAFPAAHEIGAMISFDDGTLDVYEQGLPVLDALGVPGVVFQIASMVDSPRLNWEHLLYRIWTDESAKSHFLAEYSKDTNATAVESGNCGLSEFRDLGPSPALQEALRRTIAAGHVPEERELARRLNPSGAHLRAAAAVGHEIGSHGFSHFMRRSLDMDQFERELSESRRVLESAIGQPVAAYSHPFNSYLEAESDVLSRHFEQVARVDGEAIGRSSNPLSLPRINWPGRIPNGLRHRRWLWTGG